MHSYTVSWCDGSDQEYEAERYEVESTGALTFFILDAPVATVAPGWMDVCLLLEDVAGGGTPAEAPTVELRLVS